MSDILVFIICLLDGLLLMILSVYFIICLSDLECDFLNTKQGCVRLNQACHRLLLCLIVHVHIVWCLLQWVVPELVATAFIPIFLLLTLHWVVFLVTAPFAGYLIYRYMTLPPGSMGMYDPTEIRNRGMLLRFQKEAFIKVGYHLVVFFVLLYCFVVSLVLS
ncbi:Protein cornichon homolog 4 [Geodia barretti]|uniref:Protein cornichon homolog 4 n=1 Tax=Geodia barretti TaxID=519541 RepID=A0AA35X085_GEOBA|nr:Protein cornichon homolog 4 [Geodia barretti]